MRTFDELVDVIKKHNTDMIRQNIKFTGHISATEYKSRIWSSYANDKNIKTIVEIGFNAGHSTIVLMESNLDAKLYSFEKFPIQGAIDLVKKRYGERFEIILGDSKTTVPHFAKRGIKADLIVIDGDHRGLAPYNDLVNLYQIANDNSILIIDDMPYDNVNYIRSVTEGYIYRGIEIKGNRPDGLNNYEIFEGISNKEIHNRASKNKITKHHKDINYSVGNCVVTRFIPKPFIGLLDYRTKNIGDWIQSIAALQFVPYATFLYDRDNGSITFKADGTTKKMNDKKSIMIFNAWTNEFIDFSKLKQIDNCFVTSVHIADYIYRDKKLLGVKKQVQDLKQLGISIGARDEHTEALLKKNQINAYFSGCLTLTLFSSVEPPVRKLVILSDCDRYVKLRHYIPKNIIQGAIETIHEQDVYSSMKFIDKMKIAYKYLDFYRNAKLVVTTRLHCALPCLAFGTPVIYIAKKTDERLKGMLHLFEHFYDVSEVSELRNLDWGNIRITPRDKLKPFVDTHLIKIRNFLRESCIICERTPYDKTIEKINQF
jgi:predicted O-methyltransferase YrrM